MANIGSPVQGTDFALDALGRYVCNTFDEALANSDAASRAAVSLPPRGDLRPFDFIIIGGGTFGAAVAEHLWFRATDRSERILVLEAGPLLLSGHVQNFPSLNLGREVWGVPWQYDPALAYHPNAGLAYCIGGRSLFWGGWSPRLLDSETAGTWPADVLAELNAKTLPNGDTGYFRQASQQIGVTATNDYIFGDLHRALRRQLYDGIVGNKISDAIALSTLPDAPMVEIQEPRLPPLTPLTFADFAAMLEEPLPNPLPATPAARQALEDEFRNRLKLEAPLAVQARPEHAGFFPMNKFSTVPLLIKAARAAYNEAPGDDVRKRLMVVPRSHVTRLSVVNDPDGRRVDAVLTEHGPVPVLPDCKVIIALGTIESTRLALLSFGEDGRIGKNLIAHLRSNIGLRIPRAALASLSPSVKALQASALFLKGRHSFSGGGAGHFHLQITASGLDNVGRNSEAELFQTIPDIEFLNSHLQATDSHVVITIRAIGEMQPDNPNSNVTPDLNPTHVDFWERQAYVNLQPSIKDNELWNAMDTASEDVAAVFAAGMNFDIIDPASGAVLATGASIGDFATRMPRVIRGPGSPSGRRDRLGTTHHEAGSLRLGDNPASSVTDTNCRLHGVKNVYVASPALFPTSGSPNPMLTGIALARRLGDHLLPPPRRIDAADPSEVDFRYLFEGTETSADFQTKWEKVGGGGFTRVGRALVMRPGSDGIGLLFYKSEQFDNFALRLDFCLPHPRGNANDNSGIFVRFRDPRKPVLPGTPGPNVPGNLASVAVDTGYEIQIDEEARGDTRIGEGDGFPFNRTGAIYKVPIGNGAGQQNYTNQQHLAAGIWHACEITVTDRTYKVMIDGQPSTEFTANPADPLEKFRGRKKSEDADSGFIGIQIHTGTVLFANIRVKP
jgi:choline dehydrogenase-like flavoprotein